MVSLVTLPNEIKSKLFGYIDTPSDYYQLCMSHPSFFGIGQSFNTRYSFLQRVLVVDDNWNFCNNKNGTKEQLECLHKAHPLYRSTLCQILASSPIPLSSAFAITLLKLVPTSHVCDFADYPNRTIKKKILEALGSNQSNYRPGTTYQYHLQLQLATGTSDNRNKLTIPTLANKLLVASALMCNRHRVMGGLPRRVYYYVTLQNTMAPPPPPPPTTTTTTTATAATATPDDDSNNNNKNNNDSQDSSTLTIINNPFPLSPPTSAPLSAVPPSPSPGDSLFALIHDTDTVIGFDEQLNHHYGKLWYEDEGIVTDRSWAGLLDIGNATPVNTEWKPALPSPSTHTFYRFCQRGWRPCLLQVLYQCRLKQNVRKGGLRKGDVFDCVFVYEHQDDDTICLSFCQWNDGRQCLDSRGFLLFAEHHITWSS